MTSLTSDSPPDRKLRAMVEALRALGAGITGENAIATLVSADLAVADVAEFIVAGAEDYSRRLVARTDDFELLVMTWLPGQGTGPHDHAGSLSAYRILQGTAEETAYARGPDSLVQPTATRPLREGDVGLDAGDVIHSMRNAQTAGETLVSLHVYAPPIPELRRFTLRDGGRPASAPFVRGPSPQAPVVAIVGGGYSGAMVAAQLVRRSAPTGASMHRAMHLAMHIVVLDPQASLAEGTAYRTADPRHLLNVPASNMSAWPDRPTDFLDWASHRDPSVGPYSFVSRRRYGEYLRAKFFEAMAQAGPRISVDVRRQEAAAIERCGTGNWRVRCKDGRSIEADVVVVATGHRPPMDPLDECWTGSRARYIEDPWSSLMLGSIRNDESVCLLGTGLTAIDVLQSLGGAARSAPVMAFSRRGLMPAAHAPAPFKPIDPRDWLEPLLETGADVTIRALARRIRLEIGVVESGGGDWRAVIDGLRPHIATIWRALALRERRRFLRHARAFWEVKRHRMAPAVAREVGEAVESGRFKAGAARVLAASGDLDGVSLRVRRRGESIDESLRFGWVVNCTGPGAGREYGLPPSVLGLIDAGNLEADPLGLGVRSTQSGQAVVEGRIIEDLVLIGTLRKADLWESTAVPELRTQAALAAEAIYAVITAPTARSGAGPDTRSPDGLAV